MGSVYNNLNYTFSADEVDMFDEVVLDPLNPASVVFTVLR